MAYIVMAYMVMARALFRSMSRDGSCRHWPELNIYIGIADGVSIAWVQTGRNSQCAPQQELSNGTWHMPSACLHTRLHTCRCRSSRAQALAAQCTQNLASAVLTSRITMQPAGKAQSTTSAQTPPTLRNGATLPRAVPARTKRQVIITNVGPRMRARASARLAIRAQITNTTRNGAILVQAASAATLR